MIASPRTATQEQFSSDRDRQLHAAASEALANSKYTPLRQLTCRVDGGVVEITGTVRTFYLKQLAQATLLPISPDGKLKNSVQVTEEAAASYAPTSV